MSDKPNQSPSGDESAKQDPRLSDTWVPENKKSSAQKKSPEPFVDPIIPGPPAISPDDFDGDMTFVAPSPPEPDDVASTRIDQTDNTDAAQVHDPNATFVGNDGNCEEPKAVDDNQGMTETIVGPMKPEEDGKQKSAEPSLSEANDQKTFVPEIETPQHFDATIVGPEMDASETEEDNDPDAQSDEASEEADNGMPTIVPTGMKDQVAEGDLFTATIVVQQPKPAGGDPDATRTADMQRRPEVVPDFGQPNRTNNRHDDRTLQKAKPTPEKPQSDSASGRAPGSVEFDATIVSDSRDGIERPRDRMEQTDRLSGSGTGSQSGSNIKSNIWSNSNTTSLDQLVCMRCRPVFGTGQFASDDESDANEADFEIIEKLAEGGMGVVYIAKQKSLNRELAIKTLKGSGSSTSGTMRKSSSSKQMSRADRQKREMFLSEALVTANLVHPNIIPIHELAETADGIPYYVMKRVHGIPWNKRVREMSLSENLDVLHKACDAIAYAHHHGVINRDLKPENIMLGEFGEVLVLDWGLAVPAPHAAEQNFRSPVASFGAGTPAYMSPELWTGPPEAIGECSDIYLLGAILFEIITGHPPHEFPKVASKADRSDLWQTIDKVLRINAIRETKESGELLDIALKAMRTNPDERFGSVLEFQFAVRNYQRHEESRRLSDRAAELVDKNASAESLAEYHTYQTASALFEESLRTWPQNVPAQSGLRTTRLRYANLANQKGDYDLGLQVTAREANDPEFQSLSKKLSQAKSVRAGIKWAAVAAMTLVVVLGAKSIYDNGIITNLNAEVTNRKAEAALAISEAREATEEATVAKSEANVAKTEAITARDQADKAKSDAVVALKEADEARMAAAKSNEQALAARDEATKAQDAAAKSKMEANVAIAQADEAAKKVVEANIQLAAAEKSAAMAVELQKGAETAALVAQVEVQSQSIRGLTLNENYSDALRELDRLLDGKLLQQLPETIRNQRTTELQAQRQQLLKRTRRAEAPVQTQSVSPDGSKLAIGDASGLVTVLNNPGSQMVWSDTNPTTLRLPERVASIRFLDDSMIIIASGASLYFWNINQPDAVPVAGHSQPISGLDVQDKLLLSSDESGRIIVWDTASRSIVAEMVARTSIRDIAWIPGTRDFIYAGTRGGQAADVLAYRVPAFDETNPKTPTKPERLGQLRLSRTHNYAPSKLAISPDGELLAITNGQNGHLMLLGRSKDSASGATFPFNHPADLERDGIMTWLVDEHTRPIHGLEWSRDGQKLLTASDDRSIGVWNRSSDSTKPALELAMRIGGHGARVTQATFLDADATRIGSSSTDGFSRLWDLTTYEQDSRAIRNAFQLSNHNRADDQSVASAVDARAVERQAATSRQVGSPLISHMIGYQFTSIPQTSDEQHDTDDARSLNSQGDVHRAPIRAIQFNDDGSAIVSGAADGTVAVWDVKSLKPIRQQNKSAAETFREGHEFNVSRMKIVTTNRGEEKSRILITSGYDGSLRLWNMNSESTRLGSQQQVISGVGLVNAFAASKDGQILVTTVAESEEDRAGSCHVWSMESLLANVQPNPAATLKGVHRAEVTSIAVSHDHRLIATGSREGMIAVWDSQTGTVITSLRAHAKNTSVTTLEWLSDESLFSAGLDGQLSRWTLYTAQSENPSEVPRPQLRRVVRYERGKTPINDFAVSPDEKTLLVISVETDRRAKTTKPHLHAWPVLSGNPDDSATTEAEFDAEKIATPVVTSLRSMKSNTGKEITLARVRSTDARTISSAQWSPDGSQVLVSTDLGVQLFDSSSWKVSRVFTPGDSASTDAQFVASADGEGSPLIATFDGTAASLWTLSTGDRLSWFRGPFPVAAVAISQNASESIVLAGGASLRVFSGDADSDQFGRPLFHAQKAHNGTMTAIAAAPKGTFAAARNLMISGGNDGRLKLWQWNSTLDEISFLRDIADLNAPVAGLSWSSDAAMVLAVSQSGKAVLYRVSPSPVEAGSIQMSPATEIQLPADADVQLTSCDISDNGQNIAVAGQVEGTFESIGWILQCVQAPNDEAKSSFELRCRFSGHGAGGVSSVTFVGDSPYLVSGGTDGSMILWNWQHPLPGTTPVAYEAFRFLKSNSTTAHDGAVTAVDFNAIRNTVASASEDTTIRVWSLNSIVKPK